jgi:putative addiction module component (TIGR02574 family)
MTAVVSQFIPLLAPLEVSDRADLASWLISSIEEPIERAEGYEQAWDEELEKRSRQIHAGEVAGVPSEEVFANLRHKYL